MSCFAEILRLTSRFVIIYFALCNFPFPDTFINYLVSGGCIFFSLYVRVFLIVIIIKKKKSHAYFGHEKKVVSLRVPGPSSLRVPGSRSCSYFLNWRLGKSLVNWWKKGKSSRK